MRKKISVTTANRRRAEDFFGRAREVFEHKFDGFPAKSPAISRTGRGFADNDMFNVDLNQIIEDLLNDQPLSNSGAVPCPDQAGGPCVADCTYKDTFTRTVSGGWGGSWFETGTDPSGSSVDGARGIIEQVDDGTTWIGDGWQWNGLSYPGSIIEATFDFQVPNPLPAFGSFNVILFDPCGVAGSNFVGFAYGTGIDKTISTRRLRDCNTARSDSREFFFEPGSIYSARVRVDALGTYANCWKLGEPEPLSWYISSVPSPVPTGTYTPKFEFRQVSEQKIDTDKHKIIFDNLCILPQGPAFYDNPCVPGPSGTVYTSVLEDNGDGTYSLPEAVRYVTDVWFDGIVQIEHQDYELDGLILTPYATLPSSTVVKARYVSQ